MSSNNTRKTTSNATPSDELEGQGMLWAGMSPADFSTDAKSVQGAFFPVPDRFGTLDLFDSLDE